MRRTMTGWIGVLIWVLTLSVDGHTWGQENTMRFEVDPVSRLIHVIYVVPKESPDEVRVLCSWAAPGSDDWRPARVHPLLSDTAWELVRQADWTPWIRGELIERRAAGLERTAVFNPYPEAQVEGKVDVRFRVRIVGEKDQQLSEQQVCIRADNSDVVYVDDWSKVLQKQATAHESKPGYWVIECGAAADASPFATAGTRLYAKGGADVPQLTYPLDLKGTYAVFVYAFGGVKLRLSGDERYDRLGTGIPYREELWKWDRMDWQHLIVRQNYAFTGPAATSLDYVKLVPLTPELIAELEAPFGKPDKIVAAYWEPYSYAFSDNVQDVFWHREYLGAYRDADVSIVDTQLGRFGAKVVFESRVSDQLLYQTRGDPIGAIQHPTTTNVGRMQQYTNTLQSTLKFGRELGLTVHANFGATNCYPGSPLQGECSKKHPQWMRGAFLRFEVPEVREFVLSLYRESLEIGATGLSIDFCRYPESVDSKETCNALFRELRALADKFGAARKTHIPILTRFPAHGVRRWQFFDYATWAKKGWVDYLCPSNIQGRFHYFDITPYEKAVRGTGCALLPQLDALSWGLPMPGLFLWRVQRLYEGDVQGIYIYQADSPIINSPSKRRYVRMARSTDAVKRFWERDARLRPRQSKGIFISPFNQLPGYHRWERLLVWLEGIPMGEVEIYLDGKRINHFDGPPYMVGSQGMDGDTAMPAGKHQLKIRARDGDVWLEQVFHIVSAG